jgi:hypothetical protein
VPLSDWQLQYGSLLIGDGTAFEIDNIQGLADQPDLRTSDRTRLRRHGMLPGDDFLGGRSVIVQLEVFGQDDATFQANLNTLKAAFTPGSAEQVAQFQVPGICAAGSPRQFSARPRKLALPIEQRFLYRQPIATVELFATDPRIYDATQQTQTVGLPSAGGGLTFNATFNLVFGAVSTGGTINAVNAGNFAAPWTARIDGPCTNPSIQNVGTGETLGFTISLALGESLYIDTDARTVLLGNTANRYNTLTTAQWFDLAPGTTQLNFRAVTGTSAQLTANWRSAWL